MTLQANDIVTSSALPDAIDGCVLGRAPSHLPGYWTVEWRMRGTKNGVPTSAYSCYQLAVPASTLTVLAQRKRFENGVWV